MMLIRTPTPFHGDFELGSVPSGQLMLNYDDELCAVLSLILYCIYFTSSVACKFIIIIFKKYVDEIDPPQYAIKCWSVYRLTRYIPKIAFYP